MSRENITRSSRRGDWKTPKWLFDKYDSIYHFTLDAAASVENAKCEKYYTEKQDALKQEWGFTEETINVSASTKCKQQVSLIIVCKHTSTAFINSKVYVIIKNCNISKLRWITNTSGITPY